MSSSSGRSRVAPAPERVLAGIAVMLTAMLLFSSQDGISKYLAHLGYHPIEIASMRYVFALVALLPFVLRRPAALRSAMPVLQVWRGLAMAGSAVLFVFGLSRLPIAEATAIGFLSPLLVTALSIPLLGETVGWRRWSAVIVGFLGVMMVVRPGSSAFDPAALFPLLSAASWAAGLVLTRRMRSADSMLTTMIWATAIGVVVTALPLPLVWRMPSLEAWALMAVMGLFNALAHSLVIAAFARAPASVLAPFSYSQMIWATGLGYLLFAALPDAPTWAGAAIIIASGLYTLHRERIVARQRTMQPVTAATEPLPS